MGDSQNIQETQDPAELEKLEKDFQEKPEDEIRQTVINEYELDADIDSDRISKLVNKELEHQKSLGVAIRQKRKWREEAEKLKANTGGQAATPASQDVDKLLDEKFEQRELNGLPVSNEIKKEIESYRKLNNVSVREAQNSEYIKFRIQQDEQRARTENASISGGNRTGQVRRDFSNVKEEDWQNMSDEEWAAYRKTLSGQT